MTLRNKTLIVISLVLVTFSLILVFSANILLLGGFAIVENREMENNLNRAVNAIDAETASLAAFLEEKGEKVGSLKNCYLFCWDRV